MTHIKAYSYKRAGELLRDDAPYSIRTIERMVAAGDLERIGERARRGISERSIVAYQQGERGKWRDDQKAATAAASQAPAMRPRPTTGRGSATSQSRPEATTSGEDSIPARLPRHGVIRSLPGNKTKKTLERGNNA